MVDGFILRILPAFFLATIYAQSAAAEDQTETPENASAVKEESLEKQESAPAGRDADVLSDLQRHLTEQGQEVARQKEEMRAMEERHGQEIEALKARLDSAEEAEIEALGESGKGKEMSPSINIYGFFDLTLIKYLIDEDNPIYGIQPHSLTFTMTNLNLYFAGQMTETLSSLVELRFTFLPQGVERNLIVYDREDTSVVDPNTAEELQLGNVIIERAQLTWQPYDFFGITAGRFITPFGIWNVDHGAPVYLPVYPPYIMNRQYIPLKQTGIELHGRFFPLENLYFDYALTFSNGRGPTETVYDLEDDKALGLKLKLSYKGKKISAALGGYGYYGHTKDIVKSLDFTIPGVLLRVNIDTVSEFKELDGAIDFLLEFYGVLVQAEVVRGLVTYDVRPNRLYPIVNIQDPSGQLQPDYIKWDGYILLAWQLPLERLIGEMRITPFVMLEREVIDDTLDDLDVTVITPGLNFKPNSFVVLKFDALYLAMLKSDFIKDPWWILNMQIAVSF